MNAAAAIAKLAPIKCGTCGTEIVPVLGKLDQSVAPLAAAVYACGSGNCEWKRTVPLKIEAT